MMLDESLEESSPESHGAELWIWQKPNGSSAVPANGHAKLRCFIPQSPPHFPTRDFNAVVLGRKVKAGRRSEAQPADRGHSRSPVAQSGTISGVREGPGQPGTVNWQLKMRGVMRLYPAVVKIQATQ
jgi:hypothetical protein